MRRALITVAALALASAASAQQVTKQLNLKFGTASVDGAAVWNEVEAAVCAHYAYQEQILLVDGDGKPILDAQGRQQYIPNPVSKTAFVRKIIKKFLLEHRAAYLDQVGAQQGLAAARAARAAESDEP